MENKAEEKKKTFRRLGIFLLFLLVAGLSATIFKQHQEKEAIKEQAQLERNDLLKNQNEDFKSIEQNLFEITAHESVLRAEFLENNTDKKGPLSPQERVLQETKIIQALIRENEDKIAKLQIELGNADQTVIDVQKKNDRLKRKLNSFQQQIADLEAINNQLADNLEDQVIENGLLKSEVQVKTTENEVLQTALVHRDQLIEQKNEEYANITKKMNTSYYVVGEYKELADLDVVEKEGGILGIGATKEMKEDFDQDQFIQIDRTNYTTIPVFAKKAELATSHPTDSYQWVEDDKGVQWLEITAPQKFWKQSKYLVILTDKEYKFEERA